MTVVAASEVFYVGFAKLWDLAGRRALADGSRALTRLDAHETDGGHWADWAKPLVVQSNWERQGDPTPGGTGDAHPPARRGQAFSARLVKAAERELLTGSNRLRN